MYTTVVLKFVGETNKRFITRINEHDTRFDQLMLWNLQSCE